MAGIYPRTIYHDTHYGTQQTSYSDLGICKDSAATAGYPGGVMTLFFQSIVAGIGATIGILLTSFIVTTLLYLLTNSMDDQE